MSSDIPKFIADIYYKVDKNKDGISQDEIDHLDRAKEGIGSIYIFEPGMNLNSFVNKNKSVFTGYMHFEGDPELGRQVANDKGKLEHTHVQRNVTTDTENSLEVSQGEYSIANASDKIQTMQTYGLGPCVAVTIYDKTNKKGFLTHIDIPQKAKSLKAILYMLSAKGFDINNCEARIIGGQNNSCSVETIKEIQKALDETKFKIVEMDLLGHGVRSIQLDLNTGEVSDYKETIHSRNDIDLAIAKTLINRQLLEYKPPTE